MKLDVIVFDMDGVLFYVHDSYRNAIRQTTQVYLQDCLGLPPFEGELVSQDDVTAIKTVSGFNEDWDATTAIVKYFLSLLPEVSAAPDMAQPEGASATVGRLVCWLRQNGKLMDVTVESLCRRKDIPAYAQVLSSSGTGLGAVWAVLGDINDSLLYAKGDLCKTNLVKRIFQEIYLGTDLFRRLHGEEPFFSQSDGLISREQLIPDPTILRRLVERVQLSIATGRPRGEALFALEAAGISDLFRAIVTFDDVEEGEEAEYRKAGKRVALGKPHPYSLLEAVRRIADGYGAESRREIPGSLVGGAARYAYIGDNSDDVRAANRAKETLPFVSIGCLAVAGDHSTVRMEFERAGADVVLDHPDQLLDLLEDRIYGPAVGPNSHLPKGGLE